MDKYLKERIENISEADFWSALKPGPGLGPALAAGRAGRRAAAYRLLGAYHAAVLAPEARAFRAEIEAANRTPEQAGDTRSKADMVLRHDINGWHTQRIKFGPRIDFNADFGQSGQYGFHYLHWLRPALNQYVLTGRPAYRDCFLDIIRQYYAQRTQIKFRIPSLHPVYYELGARAKTDLLLPAYALLAGEAAVDSAAREAILKLLLGFARSLHRLQQTGFRAGNWQIVGAASLYQLGAVFPEFRDSAAWRRRGAAILRAHARRDFFADGGHSERCWGYGYMSLGGMEKFYRTALRRGLLRRRQRAFWARFLKRAYRWYAASTTPSQHLLNYGDGGLGGAQGIFAAAAALFPELKKPAGLLGVDRTRSNLLRPSGYAFMRCGDRPDAPFMSINFGRTGGWHTHADLLDFTLWCYGRPLIEEVGRFGSYDNPLEGLFRAEQSHNQITLDFRGMNRRDHAGREVLWHSDPALDFFSAWHEAYQGVRIHRQIFFVKPDYWVVYDVITSGEYIFRVANNLHGLRPFQLLGPGRARLRGVPSCLVALARPEEIRAVKTEADYAAAHGPAPESSYGFARERHRLAFLKWNAVGARRPVTFGLLLFPFRGREAPAAVIRPVALAGDASGRAAAFAVTGGGRSDLLVFNPARAPVRVGSRVVRGPAAARLGGRWRALRPG